MRLISFLLIFVTFTANAKDYGNVTVSEVTSIYDSDVKGVVTRLKENGWRDESAYREWSYRTNKN